MSQAQTLHDFIQQNQDSEDPQVRKEVKKAKRTLQILMDEEQ